MTEEILQDPSRRRCHYGNPLYQSPRATYTSSSSPRSLNSSVCLRRRVRDVYEIRRAQEARALHLQRYTRTRWSERYSRYPIYFLGWFFKEPSSLGMSSLFETTKSWRIPALKAAFIIVQLFFSFLAIRIESSYRKHSIKTMQFLKEFQILFKKNLRDNCEIFDAWIAISSITYNIV